jgi:hypothetical protein
MVRKTELKQKQSQKVIVNINTEKRRKRSKPRQKQEAKPVQPAQPVSQSFSYLGLQSANNAQLLNSLQNSLNILYAKNKTATVAPPPSFATALAPPALIPPAPASEKIISSPTMLPKAAAPPVEAPPSVVPPELLKKSSIPPPPRVPPPPARAPPTSTAPVFPRSKAPQRVRIDEQSAIAMPVREPTEEAISTIKSNYDLDTNKDGTIKKKGNKWKNLPQQLRDKIIEEETAATPVKAKLIKDEETDTTEAEVVQKRPRKKKQQELADINEKSPVEEIKDMSKQQEPTKVEKAMLSHTLHTRTEIKQEPRQKSLLSFFPIKSSKVEVEPGDQTDYGELVSESEPF